MKTSASVRTLAQARAFVLRAGICGIFSDARGTLPSLWTAVDLPDDRGPGRGWGQKVTAIWRWKNELPATYPDEIFYGKIPGGLAVLMSLDHLREVHYPAHHRPLSAVSVLAQRVHATLRLDPLTTAGLRAELGLDDRPGRARLDRALKELQITLNIVRRPDPSDALDTWVPFREQYLAIAAAGADGASLG